MDESDTAETLDRDHCSYPGCTRPRRPDPATGRPSRYCEQSDEGVKSRDVVYDVVV